MITEQSPKTRAKAKAAAHSSVRWQGALEGVQRGLLYGWALDTQQPDARVVLEICWNGEAVGCLIADVARSDLAKRFTAALSGQAAPDNCHGFVADLGEQQSGVITVRIANTPTLLPGHIDQSAAEKPSVSATSKVFSDGALRVHGWLFDARDYKRTLTVRAFNGDQVIAEAVADQEHPALRSSGVGSHGFTLNLPLELADGREHTLRIVDENGNALNGSPFIVCCYASGACSLLPPEPNGLLNEVINAYERHLPRSLGMEYYPQWSARFESSGAPLGGSALRVGLILTGENDPAALARSVASLKQQAGVNLQVFTPRGKGKIIHPFSALLQQAIDAQCDLIGCVRAGDTLPPHALACALEGFALPGAELVYTDSEYLGHPWFKPAWNPEYALGSDYPLELMLARTRALLACASHHALPENSASLSWSLLATLWAQGAQAIVHVPRALYQFASPLTASEQQARRAAAQHALQSLEPTAVLVPEDNGDQAGPIFQARRLQRTLSPRNKTKTISLIIPTRDRVELLERCIGSIQQFTAWPHLEIIVVDNDSAQARSKAYFRALAKQGIKVLPVAGPFNFAALNNRAVEAASGEIIGLINNDIEALHEGWLDEIVSHLLCPGVGAVGAKLLWPNGMVQHGGVLLGTGNVAGHFGNRLADTDWGDHGRNQLIQQVSAVTAACLFLRKSDYLAVGGMDARAFPVAFNDVDLCLKLRQQGKAIIWTPHARLLHAESASRGSEETPQKRARAQREIDQLRQRWGSVLLRDPAYHPSLNLDAHSHAFGGLALPPRNRAPRPAGLTGSEV
jgi:GT2 family glycosyltransferase